MPKPKHGEVWLLRFPFSDLISTKLRPALIWATHGEDVIVLGIFSRLRAGGLKKTWVPIEQNHADFRATGLLKDSLIKAEKIAVVHYSVLQRKLGRFSHQLTDTVDIALRRALQLS